MEGAAIIKRKAPRRRKVAALGIAGALGLAAFGVYAAGTLTVKSTQAHGEGNATACATNASVNMGTASLVGTVYVYPNAAISLTGDVCVNRLGNLAALDSVGGVLTNGTATISNGVGTVPIVVTADSLGEWVVVVQ